MSKGGWFIVFAVGGLASSQAAPDIVNFNGVELICDARGCSSSLAKDNERAPNAQRASDGPAEECGEPIRVQHAAVTYSPSSDSPSDQEAQRQQEDLKAQQDMARWAFWMLVATTAGVGLIGWTLYETRKAAEIAADTLEQARKSAAATIAVAEIDAKPFVTLRIESEKGSDLVWDFASGKVGAREFVKTRAGNLMSFHDHQLWCRASNGGRSPAIVTRICRAWQVTEPRENPTAIDPANLPTEMPPSGTFFVKDLELPVGPQNQSPQIATDSDAVGLKGKKGDWLWFYGFLEFTDHTSSNRYVSGFCYLFDSSRPQRRFHTALPLTNPKAYWYHRRAD